MHNKYNILIVGAGQMGAFYDTPDSENVFTHAHGFYLFEEFNIVGFVDSNKQKSMEAASIWGGQSFYSVREAFQNKIDIVCVAVPDKYHFDVLIEISEFPVKLVFTEKPISKTMEEAKKIIAIYKDKNIELVVNYSRRFIPEFKAIRKEILDGRYGEFVTGSGYYGKGIIHNGSHLIDFLRYMLGEIKDVKVISHSFDFYDDDPSVSASIIFNNNCKFLLNHLECRNYTLFEIDLLFEKKRIRIINSGFKIEFYEVEENPLFEGYKRIIKKGEANTSSTKEMYYVIKSILEHLTSEKEIECTGEDGYKTLEVCTKMKEGI